MSSRIVDVGVVEGRWKRGGGWWWWSLVAAMAFRVKMVIDGYLSRLWKLVSGRISERHTFLHDADTDCPFWLGWTLPAQGVSE